MSEFFVPIPQMTPEEVRTFVQTNRDTTYTVLDVRQEDEYRQAHLPGAVLVPLDQLPDRLSELDTNKPTIVYCRAGGRGSSATALLISAGFERVWNLDGGLQAWEGLVAWGAPKAAMAWFDPARSESDYIALAWVLEESARKFYATMAERFDSDQDSSLFAKLSQQEEGHMAMLLKTYRSITGTDQMTHVLDPKVEVQMEGGVPLSDALSWSEDRTALEILEFSVAAEANAYDRYLKIAKHAKEPQITEAFTQLADAEKKHLMRLSQAFERALAAA